MQRIVPALRTADRSGVTSLQITAAAAEGGLGWSGAIARRKPLLRRLSGAVGIVLALAGFYALHRLADHGWPLAGAHPRLLVSAVAVAVASLFIRVTGWQRLFAQAGRPDKPACLTSASVAAISSAVVPCKLDYALKVWTLRRLARKRLAIEAGVVSICVLGLVDAVALVVPAGASAATVSSPAIRGPLLLVALFGIGCAICVAASKQLPALPLVRRSRKLSGIAARLAGRVATMRENAFALALLSFSLWVRALSLLLLLSALGISCSLTTALVFICLTAGSAFVPIPSFGLGAGTAALGAIGVSVHEAARFALATSMVSLLASTTVALGCAAFYAQTKLRARLAVSAV
jgi:hypothetical protein